MPKIGGPRAWGERIADVVNVTKLIDNRRIGGFQYLVAVLCAATVFLDGYDTQSVAFVAPSIAQELHLTRPELGPLFVASLVGLLVGQLGFGPLADKVGRRAVINLHHRLRRLYHRRAIRTAVIVGTMFQVSGVVGSVLIGWPIDKYGPYAVIPLLFAFAVVFVALIGATVGSAPALMALTFGAGFCIIGGQNSANALVAIFYPTAMHATGVGWALGIGRIGGIIGPLIAGALLSAHMSYGLLFLLGAIAPLCSTAAVFGMGRVYRR
ncbi:MAG: hypothetical protein ACREEL_05135 [Stellaceae bacterium]